MRISVGKAVNDIARYIECEMACAEVNKGDLLVGNNAEFAKEIINRTPTADVVPKSEYDEVLSSWQKIHDSYDADCIEHYKYGRAEVAREVFKEIEKHKQIIVEGVKPVYTLKERELEELKKKYIQNCTTCKHIISCEPNPFGVCDEHENANND